MHGGTQRVGFFPNGYGYSLVKHGFSYGLELAVLKRTGRGFYDFDLCYDTPITDDVIGHLNEASAGELIKRISELS
jgi:hypothetical protein